MDTAGHVFCVHSGTPCAVLRTSMAAPYMAKEMHVSSCRFPPEPGCGRRPSASASQGSTPGSCLWGQGPRAEQPHRPRENHSTPHMASFGFRPATDGGQARPQPPALPFIWCQTTSQHQGLSGAFLSYASVSWPLLLGGPGCPHAAPRPLWLPSHPRFRAPPANLSRGILGAMGAWQTRETRCSGGRVGADPAEAHVLPRGCTGSRGHPVSASIDLSG